MRTIILVGCLLMVMPRADVAAQSSDRPLLLAHYMPWYQAEPFAPTWGWHWTMNHFNPDAVGEDGRRAIASHFYPLIGPYDSRDPDVLEYHALLMKTSGIDGVIVDWYGTSDFLDYAQNHEATEAIFRTMEWAGLGFAVCYEDQTVGHMVSAGRLAVSETIAHAQEELRFVESEWMQSTAYVRLEERPVLLNFGPQYFRQPGHWETILGALERAPHFYTLDERLGTVASGAFAWPPMHRANGGELFRTQLNSYLEIFYAFGRSVWPSFIGAAFPGFHDIYAEAGVQESYGYLDPRDGATFRETLSEAVEAGSPIIQLVTWNDFGEGTNIEPTLEYGYRYLAEIRQLAATLNPLLPYAEADLELPFLVYQLRKDPDAETPVQEQVDIAVGHILQGATDEARVILTALTTTSRDAEIPDRDLSVEIFPIPASDHVTIRVASEIRGALLLTIHDVLGRTLASTTEGPDHTGMITHIRSVSHLQSGLYFVRVQTADEVQTMPLTIRR